jgi:hypothetical protein
MIKVKIQENLSYAGKTITIINSDPQNYSVVKPMSMVFTPLHPGELLDPSIVIPSRYEDFFWALAQGLAEAGYFPKVYQDKDNELTATKYHLEDMRTIAMSIISPPVVYGRKD